MKKICLFAFIMIFVGMMGLFTLAPSITDARENVSKEEVVEEEKEAVEVEEEKEEVEEEDPEEKEGKAKEKEDE